MPIATPEVYAQMLDTAKANGFAFPAINVSSSQTLNAALKGFADAGSDGIIQVSTGGAEYFSGPSVKNMVTGSVAFAAYAAEVAKSYPIHVALHTDHCPKGKLDGFVRPLLDISAAEAGVLKLNRDRLDLRTLTERAADLYREVAEEKKITVTLDQPAPAELSADAIRLGQAINNLLDNALKYTPAGGAVSLALRNEPDAVICTVSDNGPGVPAAEREAVFRRLYRGDSSRSQRGLGLGLSLVKAIVEAHGGTIILDDTPGGGARFTVRLPRELNPP